MKIDVEMKKPDGRGFGMQKLGRIGHFYWAL